MNDTSWPTPLFSGSTSSSDYVRKGRHWESASITRDTYLARWKYITPSQPICSAEPQHAISAGAADFTGSASIASTIAGTLSVQSLAFRENTRTRSRSRRAMNL